MAQKYLELFRDSAETQYATGTLPLMGLAALNEGVRFAKLAAQGFDTGNTAEQFAIQRMKRLKAATSLGTASKGAGDSLTARLNAANTVE